MPSRRIEYGVPEYATTEYATIIIVQRVSAQSICDVLEDRIGD